MKSTTASGAWGLAVIAAIASTSSLADDAGPYIGANVGQSRATIDDDRIASSLLSGGYTVTGTADDDREIGYKVFGGYQFTDNIALEGGYFDMGKFGFTATTSPSGSLTGNMKLSGLFLEPVLMLPLGNDTAVFARAGLNYAEAKSTFAATGGVVAPSDRSKRSTHYKFGLGLQKDFTEHFGMRLEAERYRIDDAIGNQGDVDLLSLGVLFRFFGDDEAPPPPPRAAAPVARPPAPVLVIVPAPVRMAQYCSILDIQYEINNDEIQREEKEKLGVLGTFLKKYPDTTAVIEGHTDNVGTSAANLELSQRRAEHVVSYLVDKFRIAASRLQAVGYGDTRPLVDNDTDEGKRLNRRIDAVIACATDIAGLKVVPARITMALLIEFDVNKADVKPEYRGELRKVADFMKANPAVTATVEGHTANLQATPELAMKISQQRAQNVVDYLVREFGADRTRFSAQGFGQERRFAYNTSAEGQQDNRRVNIVFNYPR